MDFWNRSGSGRSDFSGVSDKDLVAKLDEQIETIGRTLDAYERTKGQPAAERNRAAQALSEGQDGQAEQIAAELLRRATAGAPSLVRSDVEPVFRRIDDLHKRMTNVFFGELPEGLGDDF